MVAHGYSSSSLARAIRWILKPHFLAVCFMHRSQASAKLPTMNLVYLSLEISITSINSCGNSIELCISHLLVINATCKTGRKRKHSMNLLISICEKSFIVYGFNCKLSETIKTIIAANIFQFRQNLILLKNRTHFT